jgi:hypothetical protein
MLVAASAVSITAASSSAVLAKGITSRIVISGARLVEPIPLAGDTVRQFSVWSGPGVEVNDVPQLDGFIVNWRAGAVPDPSDDLPHFDIAFYAFDTASDSVRVNAVPDRLVYSVSYVVDRVTGEGYVYVPGPGDSRYRQNVRTILRGSSYEGHWFRASSAWQNIIASLLTGRPIRREPDLAR